MFQDSVLDSLLAARENFFIRAGLYTSDKKCIKNMVHEVTEMTKISEFINRPYGKLSGGQRRRANIARALLHKQYVWLGVWEKNERAILFYKKNSSYKASTHSFSMGEDQQADYIMRQDL